MLQFQSNLHHVSTPQQEGWTQPQRQDGEGAQAPGEEPAEAPFVFQTAASAQNSWRDSVSQLDWTEACRKPSGSLPGSEPDLGVKQPPLGPTRCWFPPATIPHDATVVR